MEKREVIPVSQYLDKLNNTLRNEEAKILGEVSGIQEYPGRSYLYFSLKDSKDGSTVKCFMWKRDYTICGVQLKEGLEIIISAYPSIYKPNGGLTLQVSTIEPVGEGALQLAYEKLKKKLEAEGLFSEERKRKLPQYPHKIGVITSKNGAVINDFLTNIGKFGFEICFVDSKVEGIDAVKDLISSVETLKKMDIDCLVIMRGGGSLESFQAFNNEVLVRLVAEFPVPVLTGIGHDKDVPLVAMVSDKNVSTPTAVANLLNSGWNEALYKINVYEQKILNSFGKIFDLFRNAERVMNIAISKIDGAILRIRDDLNNYAKEIILGFTSEINNFNEKLNSSQKIIDIGNPLKQLSKGYSIVRNKGKIVKSIKSVEMGDNLDITLSDGIINTIIK